MHPFAGKRYWLVGASEGLGAALAQALSRAGAGVVLSARSADRLKEVAVGLAGPVEVVAMDVTDRDSVSQAARAVGEVDGLVYLAGVYWPMRAQDWDTDHADAMADVNFTGLVRTLGAVVPAMVARDEGHIVVVGSLAGFRGLPGAIGYAASKAGTMVLAESLHADLRETGVKVQLANPGFIRTRLTAKNDFAMPALMEPEEAAEAILAHMGTRRFATSFPRPFAWAFRLGQFLPESLYFRLFA